MTSAAVLFLAVLATEDPVPLDFKAARLSHGAKLKDGMLEFTGALQVAEFDAPQGLDGIEAMTVGGWFFPRRSGEQVFLSRGMPETAPGGERMFRPGEKWVNFMLGTDPRGFFMGTVNGNGTMPFPYVTLNAVGAGAWHQLVVVKDARGHHKFFQNGTLVCGTEEAAASGKVWPFREKEPGEPLRLTMPLGGRAGEAWICRRELSADEIRAEFESKRDRYRPAPSVEPVLLRDMDARPVPGLWKERITAETWTQVRERVLAGIEKVFGPMPGEKVPLDPRPVSEEDCGTYVRQKVTIQVQREDRMPAYLLIPKGLKGRVPAILCFYGTTGGAGKETTVGLSGPKPGTPPEKNRGFAVDMVEAGFVAFAADYLRDGERVKPGQAVYDTTDFYQRFPEWSIHGKDVWDNMRAIDYLQSLDFVDPGKIGMVGHSYGGHSTIFAAALEPRIKAAFANGPVSDFRGHGMHWAVPKGARSSQSLPAMRPYILDPALPIPVEFYEITALIAPRPLTVGQAVGERRPMEEENHSAVRQVYQALGAGERIRYLWYPGDHDFPPHVRRDAVAWFRLWLR